MEELFLEFFLKQGLEIGDKSFKKWSFGQLFGKEVS